MAKTRSEVVSESKRKGVVAGVSAIGAVAAGFIVAPVVGAIAAVPAAYFGLQWWRHRAENGIKF